MVDDSWWPLMVSDGSWWLVMSWVDGWWSLLDIQQKRGCCLMMGDIFSNHELADAWWLIVRGTARPMMLDVCLCWYSATHLSVSLVLAQKQPWCACTNIMQTGDIASPLAFCHRPENTVIFFCLAGSIFNMFDTSPNQDHCMDNDISNNKHKLFTPDTTHSVDHLLQFEFIHDLGAPQLMLTTGGHLVVRVPRCFWELLIDKVLLRSLPLTTTMKGCRGHFEGLDLSFHSCRPRTELYVKKTLGQAKSTKEARQLNCSWL